MQVVSIICDSTVPHGICKTGFWYHNQPQGHLDAPDWIPCGACYSWEDRDVFSGELQIINKACQRVATRGMQ